MKKKQFKQLLSSIDEARRIKMTDRDLKESREIIEDSYSRIQDGDEFISIIERGLMEAITIALSNREKEVRADQIEKDARIADNYWKFDNDQQPRSTWHDKQDCLEAIRSQRGDG